MKREAWDNPKLRRLTRRLGGDWHKAAGLLEAVWMFTARFAMHGNIGKWSDTDIADGTRWNGDPAELIDLLVEMKWLDPDVTHRLLVHDWPDHADSAVRRALVREDARERGISEKEAEPRWAVPGEPKCPDSQRPEWRVWLSDFSSDAVTTESGQRNPQGRPLGDPPEPRLSPASAPPEPEPAVATPAAPASSNGSGVQAIWPEIQAAFAAYGKPVRALNDERRKLLRDRRKSTGCTPADLVAGVHGYIAYHARPTGDFDPMANFAPETVFRASKFPKYLEAHDREIAQGRHPPFPLPERVKNASDRTLSERVRDIQRGNFR